MASGSGVMKETTVVRAEEKGSNVLRQLDRRLLDAQHTSEAGARWPQHHAFAGDSLRREDGEEQ